MPGADQKPIVASSELKIIPLIQFCQNTKGMPATGKSKEIDDWVASIATDGTPDQILSTFLKEPPKDPEMIQVPDPGAAIRKFEEFWAVANLARWDFRLNQLLALYVQKYSELLKIDDPSSKGYLDRAAATGKDFAKVYEDTTKHLATAKPGSKEFPGFGPDDWRRNFDADYDKLMRFTVVVPGRDQRERARTGSKARWSRTGRTSRPRTSRTPTSSCHDPQNPAKKVVEPLGGRDLADARRRDVVRRPRRVRGRREPEGRRRRGVAQVDAGRPEGDPRGLLEEAGRREGEGDRER